MPPALNLDSNSMSSLYAYDNTGNHYNVSRIIDATGMFNATAFSAYSPLYLSYVSSPFHHLTARL